jgi:hypothetical protein
VAAYRCFLTRGQHVPDLRTIECDHDGEAVVRATMLLDADTEHSGIEVWKDTRLLARVAKSRPAGDQHLSRS